MSQRFWAALSPRLQNIASGALREAAKRQRQDIAATEADLRQSLQADGMAFNEPDIGSFRAAVRATGYYDAWRRHMSSPAWDMLETDTGRLA